MRTIAVLSLKQLSEETKFNYYSKYPKLKNQTPQLLYTDFLFVQCILISIWFLTRDRTQALGSETALSLDH